MRTITTFFAVAFLNSAAALAAEPGSADVGRFVYDQQGAIVGALMAISPQGSATVSDGLMFHPGYHLVSISASTLSILNGRVVLTGMSAADMNAQPAATFGARWNPVHRLFRQPVVPELVTQTELGGMFVIRNAGNIVPSHGPEPGGVSRTVGYEVAAAESVPVRGGVGIPSDPTLYQH